MPLEQIGQALRFDFFFTTGGQGTTGLTVTCDVYDYAGTKVVTAGAATEIGGGLYTYSMALGFNTAKGNYRAIGKTATTTVDQREIAALWVSGLTWLERIDGAISAVAAAAATAVWGAGTKALTDKAGFSLSSAGVQAIWDALTSALTTVGSVGKRIADTLDQTVGSRLASGSYAAPDNAGITAIKAKTDLIPNSPAAVGSAMTLAAGAITASVIATDAIDADALAADAVAEIQSGLATGADTTTLLGRLTAQRAANLDLLDVEVTTRATLGAGGVSSTYTLTRTGSGTPIDDAAIWVTTDSAGTNVVASGRTNASGQITFMLDAATYYFWRRKAGWNFTNPQEVVVS